MIRLLSVFLFFIVFNSSGQEKFQLAPPMLKYKSVFFSDTAMFTIIFNQPETKVYYTLNGNEPTETDLVYMQPVTINKRTVIKAKAIGKDYLPSETIGAEFIKKGKPVQEINYSKPNESYAKAKPDVLNDDIGGLPEYRSGTWIGYDSDTIEIDINLDKREKVNSVLVDLLQDENSWIFLPERIELYYFDHKRGKYFLMYQKNISNNMPSPRRCVPYEIKSTKKIISDKLRLVLLSVKKIPEWHTGKGNHGWLFIDEIIIL